MNERGGYWDPVPAARAGGARPVPEALRSPERAYPEAYLTGRWEERNWRNVPGPFYGAGTDTCGAGPSAAPGHVLCDEDGREFVHRQPRNAAEVDRLLLAAWRDPFDGYGWDGDRHWTPDSVRGWWHDRGRLREWATGPAGEWSACSDGGHRAAAATGLRGLVSYLDDGLEGDLRRYLYWLAEGRSPGPAERLPGL
ncbi:ferredoxin [Kitasatospora sp. NPDC096147]|uniref:ferredoxin n=1 Tax=Kitasatospora sp. NPDC096147 TaxID=3364093 RepID=UPI00381C1C49